VLNKRQISGGGAYLDCYQLGWQFAVLLMYQISAVITLYISMISPLINM